MKKTRYSDEQIVRILRETDNDTIAEAINVGHDRAQLSNMAFKAQKAMQENTLAGVADRGYFKGPEILACEPTGIKTYVPKPMTSNSKAQGRYSKLDFIYVAQVQPVKNVESDAGSIRTSWMPCKAAWIAHQGR